MHQTDVATSCDAWSSGEPGIHSSSLLVSLRRRTPTKVAACFNSKHQSRVKLFPNIYIIYIM